MHDLLYNKCKAEPFLEREDLLKKIVCEVVVFPLTSLDNNVCFSVAVHYAGKTGKPGENIKHIFTEQIRLIQMYKNCISKTEDVNLILTKDKYCYCFPKVASLILCI